MDALAYLITALAGEFRLSKAVNSNLRVEISSPWWAGFVSYLGGTLAMLVMAVALREPLRIDLFARTHGLSWTGGIFGAIYIAVSILMLPKIGAAMVIALIIAGQMVGSLVFDHFGLLGVPVHQIPVTRLLGGFLLLAGVILIKQ